MKREPGSTAAVLIDTVVQLLETKNPEDIRSEDVLSRSGISSGSLYHHFENLSDLIDQAIIARYSADISTSIGILRSAIESAVDRASLAVGLRRATERALSSSRAAIRFSRSQVMARAAANQRFRAALLPHQQRHNDAWAELFRALQAKGLVDASIDPVAGSLFVQAYSMGFVINDVSGNPLGDADLVDLVMRMLERTFLVPPTSG